MSLRMAVMSGAMGIVLATSWSAKADGGKTGPSRSASDSHTDTNLKAESPKKSKQSTTLGREGVGGGSDKVAGRHGDGTEPQKRASHREGVGGTPTTVATGHDNGLGSNSDEQKASDKKGKKQQKGAALVREGVGGSSAPVAEGGSRKSEEGLAAR